MKIRQYSDLYVELSQSKGEVQLEATALPPPPANGMKEEQSPSDWLCSRARPLVLSEFRKRKLFQTTNMHTISKKAARPSNIKCGCQWPQVPCTLCTGRADPTAPRELVETMMPANRVALIDAGFHPVLSFASGEWEIRILNGHFWTLYLEIMKLVIERHLNIITGNKLAFFSKGAIENVVTV